MTDVDFEALPVATLRAGARLWRIHHKDNECWFFSRGPGRFDPLQRDGLGACYWGRSDLAAWVEKLRSRRMLDGAPGKPRADVEALDGLAVRELVQAGAVAPGRTSCIRQRYTLT